MNGEKHSKSVKAKEEDVTNQNENANKELKAE